ncbi:MAG: N-acetyl sugar amidotransferase [Sphingomonas sp.]
MSGLSYRVCTRCVMDTTDPGIAFDAEGVCNHCHSHIAALAAVHRGAEGRERMTKIAEQIRREGAGKPYDCVIGVSGGVDSTYVAWLVRQLGLRPLAVHLDNGWNSDIAVRNIARTIEKLGIDLFTHVIDWEEYRGIQRAFLKASVPDVEIPTDHAIVATLYAVARKHHVRTIVSGHNDATESHLPRAWSQGHLDYGYIRDVHRRFGGGRVSTFPRIGFVRYLNNVVSGLDTIHLLNDADYSREEALSRITAELGWQDYGGKHHESVFTRWYQGCYLPRKFGYDKRKCHLSSLVSSGEMTRDAALAKLQQPPYDEAVQEQDCDYVAKKLGFTRAELDAIIAAPPARFEDFDSYGKRINGRLFRAARRARKQVLRAAGRA